MVHTNSFKTNQKKIKNQELSISDSSNLNSFTSTNDSTNSPVTPSKSQYNQYYVAAEDLFLINNDQEKNLSNNSEDFLPPRNENHSGQSPASSFKYYNNDTSNATPLSSYIHTNTFTTIQSSAPCSSCGILPSESPTQLNQNFILLNCQDLLCSSCTTILINSAANDPPREMNCFSCEKKIVGFEIVKFNFDSTSADLDEGSEMNGIKGEDNNNVEWKTPTKIKRINFGRLESKLLGELSPAKHFDWSDEPLSINSSGYSQNSTPFTTPGSTRSPTSSHSRGIVSKLVEDEILRPREWSVVRVDNIPWDLKTSSVVTWLKSFSIPQISDEDQIHSIHILCNRGNGRTLNQLFIELPTLSAAQKLVRMNNGRITKIEGRIVSIVLTKQSELMRHIFPAWSSCFESVDALNSGIEGEIISIDDLEGLIELCQGEIYGDSIQNQIKVAERPFLQIASILSKFPFHQPELYTPKLIARLFMTAEITLTSLLACEDKFDSTEVFERVVEVVLKTALACPVFRKSQKAKLLNLVGLSAVEMEVENVTSDSPSNPTSPIHSSYPDSPKSHLRSPTLDRVKNTDSTTLTTITPLRYNSQPVITSTASIDEDKRESWIQDRVNIGSSSTSTSRGIEGSWRKSKDQLEKEKIEKLSKETGVDFDLVKKVLEAGNNAVGGGKW